MKIKSEKGFTVAEIAIAIIILFIFISLISILSYNFNSSSKEIELKSEATDIAIKEIENIKGKTLNDLDELDVNEQKIKTGFTRTIIVQDYNEINPEKVEGIVKKVTVRIQYKYKKEIKTIELSTIISKES